MTVISSGAQVSAERFAESLTIEETRFEHPELIRSVDTLEPGRRNKLYRAYACLPRIQAAQSMLDDLQPLLHRFSRAHQAGVETSSAGNTAGFTNQYRVAMELAPALIQNYAALRVIDAHKATELGPALEQLGDLWAIASRIRQDTRVSITVAPGAGNQRSKVASTFRQAVESFGLDATGSGSSCQPGAGFSHLLHVSVSPECSRGYVAQVCHLDFSVSLQRCGHGERANTLIQDEELVGSHNQFDERIATERAWAKLEPEIVRAPLRTLFQSQLPVD
jgi:hypothetical protein